MINRKYNLRYINTSKQVINDSLWEFERVSVIRLDLHYPKHYQFDDLNVNDIRRFFKSLKSKVDAELVRRKRRGVSYSPERLRYIWCKEINDSVNPHYHVMIFLNKDNFRSVGQVEYKNNLSDIKPIFDMICESWGGVLSISPYDAVTSIYIPDRAVYVMKRNNEESIDNVLNRAKYLCKYSTKENINGRAFGSSQKIRYK